MEAEALHEGRAIFAVDLHPSFAGNALQGVRQQMESRLLRWDAGLEGVLLAYRNLNRLPSEAPIRPYFPYIALRVAADVLVFRPKQGTVLCGQVTKIGADFIGMTLLGCVNAAIGRQNIRSRLQHHAETGTWRMPGRPESTIEVGSDVLFTVDRVRIDASGTAAVLGAMKQPWTGAAKAAATRLPTAFADPHRWQRMQPAAQAIRMFDAEPSTGLLTSPPAPSLAAAAPVEQPPATASPQPPKKKRRRDSAAAAAAADTPEAAAAPQPAAAAAPEAAAEEQPAAEGCKKQKKKKQRQQQQQEGKLPNGSLGKPAPAAAPAAVEAAAAAAPEAKGGKKEKKRKQREAALHADGTGAKPAVAPAAKPAAAAAAPEAQPEPHRKKKKRRTGEGGA